MNEVSAKRAIKQLILINNEYLVQGLILQDQQVWLEKVAISGNTPPDVFPFIVVTVPTSREQDTGGNVLWSEPRAEYDMLISILNIAVAQEGDTTVYEQSDEVHTLFTDRIIALFKNRDNRWLTEDESQLKFELKRDEPITKTNFHSGLVYEQDVGYHSRLATEIRLTLSQGCTDDAKLLY